MLITNARIITWQIPNQILSESAVRIEDSLITDLGPQKQLLEKYPQDQILDAQGQILMPGLICAHTHFYSAFSRGLYIPGEEPYDFPDILKKLWWPLDQSLGKEAIEFSALVSLIDAIKHGTTTLFDHHASPNFILGSLDQIENSFEKAGLRGVICYEVTDRGGMKKAEEGIEENLRMIKKLEKDSINRRVKATFGLHASLTLSEETLGKCRKAIPEHYGVHIHVAEHPNDEFDSIHKTNERVIQRLNRHNLLGKDTIIVHGVHLDIQEIMLLNETQSWLTHQPRSNMNNAVGMADIDSILRTGLKVCLGNDGFSNAMWDEWRTCYLVHKNWNRDPRRMNGFDVVQMAVYNNAELTSHFFHGNRIGSIEKGAKADLILVDYKPITEMNVDNLPWHILFGFRDSMVTTTMVDGKWLMKDRKLLEIDEEEVAEKAILISKEVWKRYHQQFKV